MTHDFLIPQQQGGRLEHRQYLFSRDFVNLDISGGPHRERGGDEISSPPQDAGVYLMQDVWCHAWGVKWPSGHVKEDRPLPRPIPVVILCALGSELWR